MAENPRSEIAFPKPRYDKKEQSEFTPLVRVTPQAG
jgi:hypothetical protein